MNIGGREMEILSTVEIIWHWVWCKDGDGDDLGRYLEGDDRGLSYILQFAQGLKLTVISFSFLLMLGVCTLTTQFIEINERCYFLTTYIHSVSFIQWKVMILILGFCSLLRILYQGY
jgi:hypothetical protein